VVLSKALSIYYCCIYAILRYIGVIKIYQTYGKVKRRA